MELTLKIIRPNERTEIIDLLDIESRTLHRMSVFDRRILEEIVICSALSAEVNARLYHLTEADKKLIASAKVPPLRAIQLSVYTNKAHKKPSYDNNKIRMLAETENSFFLSYGWNIPRVSRSFLAHVTYNNLLEQAIYDNPMHKIKNT